MFHNFRRSLVKSTIAAIALGSLVAHATSNPTATSSVSLSGTVAPTISIDSAQEAAATALTMSGSQIVKVSVLTLGTNNNSGLTLTASRGSLTKTGGDPIGFEVFTVAANGTAPESTDFGTVDHTFATATFGSVTRDLYISYSVTEASQDPGEYTGTINLTVEDNS